MEITINSRTARVIRDYMRTSAEDAIDKVSKEVLVILEKNIIKYTYEYDYFPNVRYELGGFPSFEFMRSFKKKDLKSSATYVTQQIFHDWESMTTNSVTHRHWGSAKYGNNRDSRPYLARILNNRDRGTSPFRTPNWGRTDGKMRKPFWNITMEELLRKGVLDDLFEKYLKPYGFVKV